MTLKQVPFLTLLPLLAISACDKDKDESQGQEATPYVDAMSYDFEGDKSEWVALGGGGESAADGGILFIEDPTDSTNGVCQFTVRQASYTSGGVRAELTFDQGAVAGQMASYGWRLLIPDNYPDVSLKAENGAPNWQIMGQWHQQPVFEDGEDWAQFTGEGQSPPLALYYYYLDQSDPAYQEALLGDELPNIHGFDAKWDKISVMVLSMGQQGVCIFPIEKGQWMQIQVDVKWSENSDGWVQLWKDSVEQTNGQYVGSNMLNRASHYFKLGLYRNPTITQTQVVYWDDFWVKGL